MRNTSYNPKLLQQESLALAYLSYSGEKITGPKDGKTIEAQILELINSTIPKIPVLCKNEGTSPAWKVVWGPSVYKFELVKYQDNMLYVVQNTVDTSRYVVATRGTNSISISDWILEDFNVLEMKDWQVPPGVSVQGSPKISDATHTGFKTLLSKMVPPSDVPGNGKYITAFLTKIAASGNCTVQFTGHSLGGALAPTLALWFKQWQGKPNNWDPSKNAEVSVTSFAGATAGNSDFANYSNTLLGQACDRVHNPLDVVPNAFEIDTLKKMPTLYSSGGIKMGFLEKAAVDALILALEVGKRDYTQILVSDPIPGTINPDKKYYKYMKQVLYQHVDSYPTILKVPQLPGVIEYGG